MNKTMNVKGQTAKRELTFSWQRGLLTDLACFLFGHSPVAAMGTDSVYCDRCWRWGYPTASRAALAAVADKEK